MIDPTTLERLGVYLDPVDNQYKRYHPRTRSVRYDPTDPKAELKGLAVAYTQEKIPHAVILPVATDPESVEEARQKAVRSGADFCHPTHGWLRGGRKRETEAPENLGRGSVVYPSEEILMTPASDGPSPSDPGIPRGSAAGVETPVGTPAPAVPKASLTSKAGGH
jgi:hypothetical protein